jgi:hypothetical protein
MLVMFDAAPGCAQNPVRHAFGIALFEQIILTLAQAVKESLAVDRLHSTALNVIVAAIKHFADFCHFCQIPSQGIFHQVVGRAATLGGELSQTRLCLRTLSSMREILSDRSIIRNASNARRANWEQVTGNSELTLSPLMTPGGGRSIHIAIHNNVAYDLLPLIYSAVRALLCR